MSHILHMQFNFKQVALRAACAGLPGVRLEEAAEGQTLSAKFYGTNTASGVALLHLPGWMFPVVIKQDGTVAYDNYNGRWGDQSALDKVRQAHDAELQVGLLRRQGYREDNRRVEQDGTLVIELVS